MVKEAKRTHGEYALVNKRGAYIAKSYAYGSIYTNDPERARTWKTSLGLNKFLANYPEWREQFTSIVLRREDK